MDYFGGEYDSFGNYTPLKSTTNYLGGRGELEYLIEPPNLANNRFIIGLGTRFWFRNLAQDTDSGYQETWWTIYPYLGWEGRREISPCLEWFAGLRVGMTAVNYEFVSYYEVALHPKLGVTAQAEFGLREPATLALRAVRGDDLGPVGLGAGACASRIRRCTPSDCTRGTASDGRDYSACRPASCRRRSRGRRASSTWPRHRALRRWNGFHPG